MKLVYVDVGKAGQLVGLMDTGCSFWRQGITHDTPFGVNEWWDLTNDQDNQDAYFKFSTIAMCMTGNMHATLIGGDNALYFRAGVNKQYPAGTEWVRSNVEATENIRQVSCGFRGYVWAVTEAGNVLRLDGVTADQPQGASWTPMGRSSISHISIGDEGQVWANDFNGNVYYVGDNENQSWETVPGTLVQVDVGMERVIGVNNWGEIFFKDLTNGNDGEWAQINGHLKMVTTTNSQVSWGIDNQNTLWFHAEHPCSTMRDNVECPDSCTDANKPWKQCPIDKPVGPFFWEHVPYRENDELVKMVDLDVGRDGLLWGCTENGLPVVRTGVTQDQIKGVAWQAEGTSPEEMCTNIAVCTTGHVWAITPDNRVMFREGIVYTAVETTPMGTHWSFQTPSTMVPREVACGGAGQVWMTDVDGKLYRKENTLDQSNPQGNLEPTLIDDGPWSYISVGENGQIFGMRNGEACARVGYSTEMPAGEGWDCFDASGSIKNFNAGNNEIWMVNVHNEVYERVAVVGEAYSAGTSWSQVPGEQTYVTAAEETVVWAIDTEGEVWRWLGGEITLEGIVDNVEHGWTHVPQRQLVRVDVGYNAQVVGLEQGTGNALFRTGITPENVMGDDWAVMESGFTDVTMCSNGLMWATNGESLSFRVGVVDMENAQGTSWAVEDNNEYTSINCGFRARLWATTADGAVIRRTNVNSYNWKGDGWSTVTGPTVGGNIVGMRQISAGLDGHPHGVGSDGQIYMRVGVTDANEEGTAWEALTSVDAGAKYRQVSRGECQTFGVNLRHEIFRRTGCTETDPAGQDWEQFGGQLMWISVGNGPVLWGVDYGYDVWYKLLGQPTFEHDEHHQFWRQVFNHAHPDVVPTVENWDVERPHPSTVDNVKMMSLDVGRDGHVWAVDRNNQVYWRSGIAPGAINKDGSAWVTETEVYTQGPNGEAVMTATNFGQAKQVVICTNGQAWQRDLENRLKIRTGVMEDLVVGTGW
jgi:hypothetical protein